MISILIPTLDNFEYLECLVNSIREYTTADYELLVHINAPRSETIDYVNREGFDYFSMSKDNLGLPKALNLLGKKARGDYILYVNDDMFLTPGWDEALLNAVNSGIYYQYLTAAMFEPQYENVCMNSPMDYGRTPTEFRKQNFLDEWKDVRKIKEDIVSPYCPIFVTKALWDEVGGYDERYFPCFGTDPDFAAKIYFAALKKGANYEFRAVADAGVYHFQCITTDRIPNNASYRVQAAKIFKSKWGMDWGTFYKQCLQIGKKCE